MSLVRFVARPMLASIFVVRGWKSARNPQNVSPAAQRVTDRVVPTLQRYVPAFPSDPTTLARLNGVVQLSAGAALATGRMPRLSSLVLAGSLVPTTIAGHAFWEVQGEERQAQQIQFLKNASMAGGLLIAGVDLAGRPGVGYRAKRVTRSMKKDAKRLSSGTSRTAKRAAHTARREAKLAAHASKAQARSLLP